MASLHEESTHMSCLSEALLCVVAIAAELLTSAHTALEMGVPHYPVIRHLFDEPPGLEQSCTLTQQLQYMKVKSGYLFSLSSTALVFLILLTFLACRKGKRRMQRVMKIYSLI